MSDDAPLEAIQEESAINTFNKMLDKKKVPLTTEIKNPPAMSALEIISEYFMGFAPNPKDKEHEGAVTEELKPYIRKYKINMVAFNRKRAEEVERAFRSLVEIEMQKERNKRDQLLGDQR